MKLNYYLRPGDLLNRPVYLFVSLNGQREKIGSPVIHINGKHWNSSEKCVKQNVTGREELQKKLDDFKKKVGEIYDELPPPVTIANIKEKLDKPTPKISQEKLDFFDLFDAFIKSLDSKISPMTGKVYAEGTKKNFRKTKNKLKKFSDKHWPDLTLKSFDQVLEVKFRDFMIIEEQITPLSYGEYIKNIKTFFTFAKEQGYKPNKKAKKFHRPRPKGRAKGLKKEELLKLYDLNLSRDPILERDWLICLVMVGTALRISDYNQLDPAVHIEEMTIKGQQVQYVNLGAIKNEEECIVPYFDDLYFRPKWAIETILSKYGKMPKITDRVTFNKHVSEVLMLAGITRIERPSSKIWRKTWASVKRKLGMNREMIKKVTGHRDDKSLNAYIGVDPEDILSESLDKAVNLKAS